MPSEPTTTRCRQTTRTARHLASTSVPLAVPPEENALRTALFSLLCMGLFCKKQFRVPPPWDVGSRVAGGRHADLARVGLGLLMSLCSCRRRARGALLARSAPYTARLMAHTPRQVGRDGDNDRGGCWDSGTG